MKSKYNCSICLNEYELNYFPKNKTKKFGHDLTYCKNCANEKSKKYYYNNIISVKHKRNQRYLINKEKENRYMKKYMFNRRKNDLNFRILNNLRTRIWYALKNNIKTETSTNLLGCDIKEFKKYLEKQFDENMSWNNYGPYWHIDHIKPCCKFNLLLKEEQQICFHYTNLQPLESIENIKKGGKYE